MLLRLQRYVKTHTFFWKDKMDVRKTKKYSDVRKMKEIFIKFNRVNCLNFILSFKLCLNWNIFVFYFSRYMEILMIYMVGIFISDFTSKISFFNTIFSQYKRRVEFRAKSKYPKSRWILRPWISLILIISYREKSLYVRISRHSRASRFKTKCKFSSINCARNRVNGIKLKYIMFKQY